MNTNRKSLRELVKDELSQTKKSTPAVASVKMGSATYTKMLGKRY